MQVGDPFIEKSLIEACLDAFKTGDVIAAQDMGAAGLTCSSAEMAANGKLGISIDLDLVPSREDNMSSYQYLFCLLYTSPSPRDPSISRMPSSA